VNAPAGLSAAPALEVDFFDGRSARSHRVRIHVSGERLLIAGDGIARSVPLAEVQWPERTRHGARVAHLKDGGALHCTDATAWDAWARASGRGETLVVKAQQSWRWVGGIVVALVLLLAAGYLWGLPWASRAVVAMLPHSVDREIGNAAMKSVDGQLVQASELPAAQQAKLRAAFERAVAQAWPQGAPPHELLFRRGKDKSLGPNAFALPGGTMVLTDELVALVDGDEAVILGVLGHELGHVRHRHGLRMLVQATALGVVTSVVIGDFSSLLAGVPLVLGQAGYARDAEREADADSVHLMKAAGISPDAMVRFFEKVAAERRKRPDGGEPSWLGIAIASHPADDDRIRYFREAAAR
jgi:Zn-dependent protease with chaperone function